MRSEVRTLVVALAGNPNSGKTTIFNNLTGASQHVGNYPGVTVEKKEGTLVVDGFAIKFVDLPGTYSLSAYSIEEIIARNFIVQEKPDVVIDIVDASNLERNLYLTTQIVELGIPMIIALNMSDMARSRGISIDSALLSQLLGLQVVSTIGNKNIGMDRLVDAIVDVAENGAAPEPASVNYGKEFETELSTIAEIVSKDMSAVEGYRPRWIALKLLENDAEVGKLVARHKYVNDLVAASKRGGEQIQSIYGDAPSSVVSDRRYGFISGACSEAIQMTGEQRHDMSDKIDSALIHPIFGLPIFAALMWLMFNLTFTLGEKPMEFVEAGVVMLSEFVSAMMPAGLLRSLLVDGVIAGVGGVLSFLPNIMLLFLAIAVLEDTGYMARAAFVMDRIMHRIGLHGKSFIPMLIGFGCTVPAYMSSRILEDKTDRLVTMHVATFMSCGARLPVYILVCGAFWPGNAGTVIFSIYALGVVTAIVSVKLLRSTRFKGMSSPFIMELPPYRVPTLRSLLIHMWERSWLYLKKAGTIILGVSIVMWFMMTFPKKTEFDKDYDSLIQSVEQTVGSTSNNAKMMLAEQYRAERSAERMEYSAAGRIGKFVEPVIAPLGMDWRLGVAIFAGFAAKEVVVSTMGTVYGVGESDEESRSLRRRLSGDPKYSKLTAYSFMVFVLLYMPCMAALAVFQRESGSWKELFFQITYTLGLAWVMAFVVYQGGRMLGIG